jgi:2'-5' RNA ligase
MPETMSLDERRARSAILIAVPEVVPLIGRYRRAYTADGGSVPPHVTLLSPFLAPEEITPDVHERIATATADTPAFTITLHRTRWFGDRILYLAPDPAVPIVGLVSRLREAFSDVPTYWDHVGVVIPHVTVADADLAGGPERLREIERSIVPQLPFAFEVRHIALTQRLRPSPAPWDVRGTYALA